MEQAPVLSVACAVPYALDTVPNQRFRWEQWAPLMRDEGVEIEFIPFCDRAIQDARARGRSLEAAARVVARWPAWALEMSRTRRSGLLVVHRNAALAGPPLAELALHALGVPFVYDFDDAIFLPPPRGDSWLRRQIRADWRVATLARRAALVTAGSPFLATWARQFTPHVEVWPTTIAMSAYAERPRAAAPPGAKPVIGWSGSVSTGQCLEPLLPVLRELQRKEPFHLLVVGAQLDLGGMEGECIPWTAGSELAALHRMDIGLMPLPDTDFTRGKCALKALQYLAVGTPAVVSDVGVNAEAVPDGQCGFVVRTDQEWIEALTRLLRDPALRAQMGQAGRAHVAARYSAEVWAPRLAARLRTLASTRS